MDAGARNLLIDQYARGYEAVRAALETIGPDLLDRAPADGGWTPRMVCHHLCDSEMTSAIRLRKLLAEDNAEIVAYDEERFAEVLFYDRDVEASLDAFRAARAATVPILRRLTDEQWARTGTHSDSGAYSVEMWLEIYASHAMDHAAQILAVVGEGGAEA